MCSIEQRLDEIGRAIEELAIQARMPAPGEASDHADEPAESTVGAGEASTDTKNPALATDSDDSGRILARLAELWGLLADLDPEVARRLAGYQALLSPVRQRTSQGIRT